MSLSIREKILSLAQGSQRSSDLLVRFSDGFAAGWFMAVKECFRTQLDIKYTARIESPRTVSGPAVKKQIRIWTQGPRIAFDAGHVFYDSPRAYGNWADALAHNTLACVVLEAAPNEIRRQQTAAAKASVSALIDGYVVIELFAPNRNKTRLKSVHKCKLSQNDFLVFLKTGELNQAGDSRFSGPGREA